MQKRKNIFQPYRPAIASSIDMNRQQKKKTKKKLKKTKKLSANIEKSQTIAKP